MRMCHSAILLGTNKEYTIMKKIYTLFAVSALLLCSCTEDDSFGLQQTAQPGDVISFGGSLDVKKAGKQTRTVYGDKIPGANGYTEIKWSTGDQVRIYCNKAVNEKDENIKGCNYSVLNPVTSKDEIFNYDPETGEGAEDTHSTALRAVDADNGLCWADNDEHVFYGVYPSDGQLKNVAGADTESQAAAGYLELKEDESGKGILKGFLPNKQLPLGDGVLDVKPINDNKNNHYSYYPAMRYAYMVAKTKTTPVESVPLTFYPVVTAVEITLVNNSTNDVIDAQGNVTSTPTSVEEVSLVSVSAPNAICGEFETTISDDASKSTNKLLSTTDAYKTVTVPVNIDELKHGDKLTFTVFMVLNGETDLSQLSVSILAGSNSKTATIKRPDNGIVVEAKCKNFLSNIPLKIGNVSYAMGPGNWLEYIPDETTVGALSIPGAGGAASGNKSGTAFVITDEASRQQNLSIAELWAQGVRCFEFLVDNNSSLGSENVYCNLESTGKTLNAAMGEVLTCLQNHPKEFAVVIVGYQEKDITTWTRQVGQDGGFSANFNSWWTDYIDSTLPDYTYTDDNGETKFIDYGLLSAATTVKEARGSVFMIARHTAMGLDGGWYTGINDTNSASDTYVGILGWGTHPDQWYARGYGNINSTSTYADWDSYDFSYSEARPYYAAKRVTNDAGEVTSSQPTAPASAAKKTTGLFEYGMTSTLGSITYANLTKAYIQEWRRVMPTAALQAQYGIDTIPSTAVQGGSSGYYHYNWAPSSDQKWTDVTTALSNAMNKTGGYGLYINSLCGYFIDGSITQSYQPLATFQKFNRVGSYWLFGTQYITGQGLDDKYHSSSWADLNSLATSTDRPNRTTGDWGPYLPAGGYKGNIGAYASWINNLFYNYLLTLQANGTLDGTKGTGIVLMDRVSSDASTNAAGYYIPRIILSNNEFDFTVTPSANGLSITVATEEVNSDNSDDYKFAAPEKR